MATSNFLRQTSNTAMNTENKDGEKRDDGALTDRGDDLKWEVFLEDEWSLTEDEGDLEATVKAIRDQAEHSSHRPGVTNQQPSVVDFLRSFLYQTGMTETLDCFQAEWSEMVQRGLVDEERVGVVPAVYTENQRLEWELKNARRKREEFRQTASAAAETLARVQKTRDAHRLLHKRLVQEKNKIKEDMEKLKQRCDSYEPEVQRMNEKYRAALRRVTPMALEGDTP